MEEVRSTGAMPVAGAIQNYIWKKFPDLSIIIAYHDEGKEFLLTCIDSIESTIDIASYEIIVVDDCSLEIIQIDGIKIIRHKENRGVGAAFDTGVKAARSKNIFLTACDCRFTKNQWASKMLTEIHKHPKALICSSVVPLDINYPELTFDDARKFMRIDLYHGASIKFFIGDDNTPHHILEAEWLPREFIPLRNPDFKAPAECVQVPCILGACYGTTKKWYKYIDGFWGHRFWGTLEPLISLKSWLFGGECLNTWNVETAHIFKAQGSHNSIYNYGVFKTYNRMLLCWLLFTYPEKDRLLKWLPEKDYTVEAASMIEENIQEILKKRDQYRDKMKMSVKEFAEKFKLEYEN